MGPSRALEFYFDVLLSMCVVFKTDFRVPLSFIGQLVVEVLIDCV